MARIRREPRRLEDAEEAQVRHEGIPVASTPNDRRALTRALASLEKKARRPDTRTEAIARAYLRLAEAGIGYGRRKRVEEEFGLPTSTVRDHLKRAEVLGYLKGGQRGKASYTAGPLLTPTADAGSERATTKGNSDGKR